jgi:hypothetical protein
LLTRTRLRHLPPSSAARAVEADRRTLSKLRAAPRQRIARRFGQGSPLFIIAIFAFTFAISAIVVSTTGEIGINGVYGSLQGLRIILFQQWAA